MWTRHCHRLGKIPNFALNFIPKPHKPPSSASALRPIGLLRPDSKALAGHIKNLILEQAGPSLAQSPQFAYLPSRDTTDALARVNACIREIKASVKALGGNRFVLRQRKETGQTPAEAGGCLLSVDLSQAFDRVNRIKLDEALQAHQVDADIRSTVTAIHEEAAYAVRDRFQQTSIATTQGIRQGCRLAPALWDILSSQVLWDLTMPEETPMRLPLTLYADDHLGHWLLKTTEDIKNMDAFIVKLFNTLESYGLKVNPEKSSLIIRVQGYRLNKLVRGRTVIVKQQPHWKIRDRETEYLIPICDTITYLGTKLSLKEGSDQTLDFRIAEAASKVTALRKSIRARQGFSRHHRVRVWQTCVVSSAMYGLLTTQFNGHMVSKLRAWFHRQLRAVFNMPAHLTKISNSEVRAQFGLEDPIQILLASIERKIAQLQSDASDPATKGPGILSFWQDLHHNLQQADTQATSAQIIEAPSHGQHACPTCGLYYSTKKALRQHQALRHGQIQADRVNIN